MKNIFFLILLFLIGGTSFGQSWNRITGKNEFTDSLKFSKYKSPNSLDSVLTVNPTTGTLMFVLRSSGGSGVDSIVIHQPDSICWYDNGLETCFALGRAFDSASLNLDSTYIKFWNQGNFLDSILLPHTNVYNGNNINIRDTADGSPFGGKIFDVVGIQVLNYGLISGGIVSHDTLYKYYATAAQFNIGGLPYTSGFDSVTLTPSDPSLDRRDVIAVDITGNLVVVTGTPGANPQAPQVDPGTQVYLTEVLVKAGSTTPIDNTHKIVWDENLGNPAEFSAAVTSGGVSANFNSTTTPRHLVKSADIAAWVTPGGLEFTYTTLVVNNYNMLTFWINLKGVPSSSILVRFLRGTSLASGGSVVLDNTVGYSRIAVGWQLISIPFSRFAWTLTEFTKIQITMFGTGAGLYLDYIQLQNGIPSGSSPYITGVRRRGGTDSVEVEKNNAWGYAFTDSTGGGGGAISSVTGDLVDNTDPANPIVGLTGTHTLLGSAAVDLDGNTFTLNSANTGILIDPSNGRVRNRTTAGKILDIDDDNDYALFQYDGSNKIQIESTGSTITGPIFHNADSSTAPFNVVTIDENNQLRRAAYSAGGGGTTIYETETASGSTTFTFTTVPADFADFIILVNGSHILPTTDYTVSGNDVTIPSVISGDVVVYRRIK